MEPLSLHHPAVTRKILLEIVEKDMESINLRHPAITPEVFRAITAMVSKPAAVRLVRTCKDGRDAVLGVRKDVLQAEADIRRLLQVYSPMDVDEKTIPLEAPFFKSSFNQLVNPYRLVPFNGTLIWKVVDRMGQTQEEQVIMNNKIIASWTSPYTPQYL